MCRHMQKPFEIDGQKVHIEIIPALDVHPNVEQVCEENILFVKVYNTKALLKCY